jgi:hypothetical protein
VFGGETDEFGNFGGSGREGHEFGAAFFDRAVVFVEDKIFRAGQDSVVAEKSLQRAG